MRSQSIVKDRLILIVGTLILLALAVRVLWKADIQNFVLVLTAWTILWYTDETMRIRKDAEARAEREKQPLVHFGITQFPNAEMNNANYRRFHFHFRNESANPGLAVVRIRLSMDSEQQASSNPAYNGEEIWEITPYYEIRGWFALSMFSTAPQVRAGSPLDMQLNTQVDLYWPDHKFLMTMKSEYRLHVSGQVIEFWPEVRTAVPELPPKQLA